MPPAGRHLPEPKDFSVGAAWEIPSQQHFLAAHVFTNTSSSSGSATYRSPAPHRRAQSRSAFLDCAHVRIGMRGSHAGPRGRSGEHGRQRSGFECLTRSTARRNSAQQARGRSQRPDAPVPSIIEMPARELLRSRVMRS